MNMDMVSMSNSTTFGVPSFTTCPFSTTGTRTCCIHVPATPNAKSRDSVSLSLSLFKRRSLGGFFTPIETTLGHLNAPISALNSGKSSKIPKDFLVQILGEERVIKFAIQEILNSTMADYVKKENMDEKEWKISTTQTAEQLKKSFTPGNDFGFNVIIEPENQ
uniref:Trigger factor ribosome-binding bacterial domain-containing protein n=1 Tax=Phaseolus vulgaris TaxID=3885 RepID=V7AF53_PHAVU|nr:hypothetical protein PHAVU_011G051000g [Phaseolus vulgaris]ESW03905.1 hypothetical protein PHAVU_011G051000g [Phaseolus vulgaris]